MAGDPNQQNTPEGRNVPSGPQALDSNLNVSGPITVSAGSGVLLEPNYSAARFWTETLFDGTEASHQALVERNTFFQNVDKIFDNNLKHALGQEGRDAQVRALREFDEKPLTGKQIVQIAKELALRGAAREAVEFLDAQKYNSAVNNTAGFFDSPEVKQWQADALQKIGFNDEALSLSNQILKDDPKNSEALRTATMARVAQAGDNRVQVMAEYEQGFAKTGNYSLGMGALNAALETGDTARAKQLAPLVALAAKNVGADQSKSFWPALINAQAATVNGDVAETQRAMLHLVDVLGATNSNGTPAASEVDKTKALERIQFILSAQPDNAKVRAMLDPIAERLEMSLGKKEYKALPYEEPGSVDRTFRERGYTSRQGMTPEGFNVSGNVRVGGMLPDSATTIRDKMQFLEVAKTPLDKFIESGLLQKGNLPLGVDTTKSLSEIGDLETRIKASQQVARAIFDVDGRNMENLHGLDHKIYDSVVRLRLEHSGATSLSHLSEEQSNAYLEIKKNDALYKAARSGDVSPEQREALSRLSSSAEFRKDPVKAAKDLITEAELFRSSNTQTNIAVAAEQGIGDCRHVAAAAEALVSAVQQDRTSDYIRQATESLAKGDNAGYQRFTEAANKEINGYEMRIYDQTVNAAVEVADKYKPILTADGKFVAAADSQPRLIETHMHNVVRMEGSDGKAKYVVADAFYQKGPYPMGWVENSAPETFREKGMDKLRLSGGEVEAVVCERKENGELVMKDGHPVPVIDKKTGQPKTVKLPLVLESTEYSSASRLENGTPTPESRLNGSPRPQNGLTLAESLQVEARNADYVMHAEYVAEHLDKVTAPELKENPADGEAARRRVLELKDATATGEASRPENARPMEAEPKPRSASGPEEPSASRPKTPQPNDLERPAPRPAAVHTDYVASGSAAYTAFVQGQTAIDSGRKFVEDVKKGDTVNAAVDGTSAAVNGVSSMVGVTQLVAERSKEVAEFAQKTHLGAVGETLGFTADAVTLVQSYVSGKDTGEALDRTGETLLQIGANRAAIALLGVGGTGFVTAAENSGANYQTRVDAQAALDKIQADTRSHVNLNAVIEALKAEKSIDPATKKEVPAHPELQGLKLDAKGRVDLGDASNQKKIRDVLTAADKALSEKIGATRDQFVVPVPVIGNVHVHALDGQHSGDDALSDAGRDPVAARAAASAEVQRKGIEVAMAELDAAADASKFTKIAARSPAQKHDDVVLAQRRPGGTPEEQVVVTTTRHANRLTQDDRKQPVPEEMLRAFRADPTHNLTWELPLYKKDEHGKPVRDAKGQPVVGKIMRYEIIVTDGEKARPSSADWRMTQAEQQQAFGGMWQAQRRLEAKDKVDHLHQQFLKDAKAFMQSDPKVSSKDVIEKYQRYIDSLKELKGNAKALGIDPKEVETAMNGAGKEYTNTFDPRLKSAPPPSIMNYKTLQAVGGSVLKDTPASQLNGKLDRDPDGRVRDLRQLDLSDPKNLAAFKAAIEQKIKKDAETIAAGKSVFEVKAVSQFLGLRDSGRKVADATAETQQLQEALRELERLRQDVQAWQGQAAAANPQTKPTQSGPRPQPTRPTP